MFQRARAAPGADSRPIRRQPRDGAVTTHEPPAAAGPYGLKTEAANEAARTLRRRIHPLDKHTLANAEVEQNSTRLYNRQRLVSLMTLIPESHIIAVLLKHSLTYLLSRTAGMTDGCLFQTD